MTFNRSFNFTCKFCNKGFVLEQRFLAHRCEEMIRDEQIRTPLGQAALSYYQLWFKQQRRMVPNTKAFVESRFYKTFIKFAEFVQYVKLPMPHVFIGLMISKKFQPSMWCMDEVYGMYLNYLDTKMAPFDRVKLCAKTLMNLADRRGIDVSNIFDVLTPSEVIHGIQTRIFTPWLFLFSTKFLQFYENIEGESKDILERLISPESWMERIAKLPGQEKQNIQKIVAAMGL